MKYAAAETRRILRDRFVRYLPVSNTPAARLPSGKLIRDELLLNLLLNLKIAFESEICRARATYQSALPENAGEPSFDEVRSKGYAKSILAAAIAELKNGLSRNKIPSFYIEAVVSIDNEPSKRVAEALIASTPTAITDEVSGLPALHYVRKI
jgi:hypothetical protein